MSKRINKTLKRKRDRKRRIYHKRKTRRNRTRNYRKKKIRSRNTNQTLGKMKGGASAEDQLDAFMDELRAEMQRDQEEMRAIDETVKEEEKQIAAAEKETRLAQQIWIDEQKEAENAALRSDVAWFQAREVEEKALNEASFSPTGTIGIGWSPKVSSSPLVVYLSQEVLNKASMSLPPSLPPFLGAVFYKPEITIKQLKKWVKEQSRIFEHCDVVLHYGRDFQVGDPIQSISREEYTNNGENMKIKDIQKKIGKVPLGTHHTPGAMATGGGSRGMRVIVADIIPRRRPPKPVDWLYPRHVPLPPGLRRIHFPNIPP